MTMRVGLRPFGWRLALIIVALVVPLSLTPTGSASVSPSGARLVVHPGDTATEPNTISVPATPAKADIELAIDTTGSMQPSINAAKADATSIVDQVQRLVGDTRFAVVQFKDNGDAPEYSVEQPMTDSAAAVQAAVNRLSAGGGGDNPEAYNLVFNRADAPETG